MLFVVFSKVKLGRSGGSQLHKSTVGVEVFTDLLSLGKLSLESLVFTNFMWVNIPEVLILYITQAKILNYALDLSHVAL